MAYTTLPHHLIQYQLHFAVQLTLHHLHFTIYTSPCSYTITPHYITQQHLAPHHLIQHHLHFTVQLHFTIYISYTTIQLISNHTSITTSARLHVYYIHDAPSILHHLHFTIYTSPSILHHLYFTIYTSPSTLHHLHFTIYTSPSTLHHLYFTVQLPFHHLQFTMQLHFIIHLSPRHHTSYTTCSTPYMYVYLLRIFSIITFLYFFLWFLRKYLR